MSQREEGQLAAVHPRALASGCCAWFVDRWHLAQPNDRHTEEVPFTAAYFPESIAKGSSGKSLEH